MLSAGAAEHVPNAAGHIGTVVINNGDQFTTNVAVSLSLNAVNNGTGVSQMQFSQDNETWSSPEPYQTAKSWSLLDDGVFPPRMNTVLKTVYVRFQDGAGNWSKAVSDSIVLARTSDDVPRLAEVWIAQTLPADYWAGDARGSRRNPFLISPSSNEVQFDTVMNSLWASYSLYAPTALSTTNAVPAPATNATALTIHIGPGIYETHGECPANPNNLKWWVSSGWRVLGAGKDLTTLKAVGVSRGLGYEVNILSGAADNAEIADLTLDANIHEGGTNMTGQFSQGLVTSGSNLQIRRVRVKNSGSHKEGAESSAINMQMFGATHDNYNLILEDCEVIRQQYGNTCEPEMITIGGIAGPTNSVLYYHNVIVRNCYVDGTAYDGDQPIDARRFSCRERGNQAFNLRATWGGIVEDNVAVNTSSCYYVDTISFNSVTVRNNHFRTVLSGAEMQLFSDATSTLRLLDFFKFDNNLVEFDPHFYTNKETWGSTGARWAFRFLGDLHGAPGYIFNRLILTRNVFQFDDQGMPDANVVGVPGEMWSCQTAEVRDNIYRGMPNAFRWHNDPEYLDLQADIIDASRPCPLICSNNTLGEGTIAEAYPYVLDKTLPRPTAVEGDEVAFPVTLADGSPATVVSGVPTNATVSGGVFRWQTTPQDAGRYLVSFYGSASRWRDPRRTFITVQDRLAPTDPQYAANGLRGWWKFSETLGTSFLDSSGNGLALEGSRSISSGYLTLGVSGYATGRKAVHFNARSPSVDLWVLVNADPLLLDGFPSFYYALWNTNTALFRPFSLGFWFKMDAKPARPQALFSRYGATATLYFQIAPSTNQLDQNVSLSFAGMDGVLSLSTPPKIAATAWHQVLIAYDGLAALMYVDGVKAAEQRCGQLPGYSAGPWLCLGAGVGLDGYVGSLADLAVWNRALSSAEISRLYTEQKAGTVAVAVPIAPTRLAAWKTSATGALITWQDNSLNETGFVVERGLARTTFSAIATVPSDTTSFVDTVPDPTRGYYYRVKAINSLGSSAYSATEPLRTSALSPPGSPRAVR